MRRYNQIKNFTWNRCSYGSSKRRFLLERSTVYSTYTKCSGSPISAQFQVLLYPFCRFGRFSSVVRCLRGHVPFFGDDCRPHSIARSSVRSHADDAKPRGRRRLVARSLAQSRLEKAKERGREERGLGTGKLVRSFVRSFVGVLSPDRA